MLVVKDHFLVFNARQVWWPDRPEEVFAQLSRAPVVTVMQCGDQVACALEPHSFRSKPFDTSLIDLSVSETDLWSRLDPKSCRYHIRKVKEIGCCVTVNEDREQAFDFINAFFSRRKFRRPMSSTAWQSNLEHGDVFIAKHEGRILAAHLVLVDPPLRARIIFGATARLEGGVEPALMGGVNRYLHWYELDHYRARGIARFDFGGIDVDPASPLHSITRFKLSFGGDIVRQHILRLSANRGLRVTLKQLARAKRAGDAIRRFARSRAGFGATVAAHPLLGLGAYADVWRVICALGGD
jgi:Acetyltransferase (GNAT) domain